MQNSEVRLHVVAIWMAFILAGVEFLLTSDMGFISKLLKKMGQKNELCYQDSLHKNSRGREGNVWKRLYDRWGDYAVIIAFFNHRHGTVTSALTQHDCVLCPER